MKGTGDLKLQMNKRILEIDVVRVIAMVLMIVFHFVYDLNEFLGINIDYLNGFWYYEGKLSALLFIFISGISNGFSRKPVRRGIKILFYAMIITIVTYVIFPDEYIRFGILHFLGTAMIISPVLRKFNNGFLILLAFLSVIAGSYIKKLSVDTYLFLPFGAMYDGFSSMDYYPIFPYIAFYVLGIVVYKKVYSSGKGFIYTRENYKVIRFLSKNSLGIYVLHQPILLLFIFLMKKILI